MKKSDIKENSIIKFDNIVKNLRMIRQLGEGGTGSTFLLFDESVEQYFAFKKYDPYNEDMKDELYDRFVNEIKILFHISHPNIVRVYNHYLYPDKKIGYIQMEYIEGTTVDKIDPNDYGKRWDDYFIETIDAFHYLHNHKILHRDIRPQNLMIDKEGHLKLIDFGFGKHITLNNKNDNSVVLNWPASKQAEEIVNNGEYNASTEIYYLGNLFKHLLKDKTNFSYFDILDKMSQQLSSLRYNSLEEIKNDISKKNFGKTRFTKKEKEVYLAFADSLIDIILVFTTPPTFNRDVNDIQKSLKKIADLASLEDEIFNSQDIINCFILSAKFKYHRNRKMYSGDMVNFYKLFSSSNYKKQKAIIEAIIARLEDIPIELEIEDVPF